MKEKVGGAVEAVLSVLVKLLGIGLVVTVFLQIVTRYIPNVTLVWTEELSRFLFVWYAMLSVAVAYIENKHLSLDILYDKFGPKMRKVLDGFSLILILVISTAITYQGFKLLKTVSIQKSPILRLSMAWCYAAIPVGFVFIAVTSLLQVIDYFISLGKKEEK